ncbi:MAG: TRAP transporter large permease [Thermoleophilia bacterium]|nr:TRAP transporter large permease [Thermoleophilia bacterium]
MNPTTIAVIGIVVLVVIFLLRMPVAYAMGVVGFVGFIVASSWSGALRIVAKDLWATFSSYSLSVAPMFVLMGTIAFYSGISGRLFDAANKWLGRLPGGLSLATIAACAGFGAMCGSTTAAAAAMGKVTLPEMKRYGYDDALRTGCIASAGSLAIMIPPSTVLIIYGVMTEQSIGKLFIAGILPGLLLAVAFMAVVLLLVWRNPGLAPPGVKTSWKEKFFGLSGIIEMLLLFALVMGGLFVGWFTPTEAGAVGAFGAIIIALARRKLTLNAFWQSLKETTRITAMVFLIIACATIFGHFMAITRAPFALSEFVGGLPLPSIVIMMLVMCIYLIGGCFMDSLALVTLTIPILYPIVTKLGYDPIWFGVLIILAAEMGVITPPVGVNVYVIKGVAPDVPMHTIFRGIWPFLGAEVICTVIILFVPQIALFLPNLT